MICNISKCLISQTFSQGVSLKSMELHCFIPGELCFMEQFWYTDATTGESAPMWSTNSSYTIGKNVCEHHIWNQFYITYQNPTKMSSFPFNPPHPYNHLLCQGTYRLTHVFTVCYTTYLTGNNFYNRISKIANCQDFQNPTNNPNFFLLCRNLTKAKAR